MSVLLNHCVWQMECQNDDQRRTAISRQKESDVFTVLLAWLDATHSDFHPMALYLGTVLIDLSMWQAITYLFGAK